MIQALYLIEKECHSASDDERLAQRQLRSMPILEEMKKWLNHQKVIALPKSPLGKAVTYTLNNWKALNTFTSRGDLTIDNNKSENALRSMAVGRKNWLFMGSKAGGQTATIIASFLSTCKAHNIHPRIYLADVLTRLAQVETDLDALLPGNWRPACALTGRLRVTRAVLSRLNLISVTILTEVAMLRIRLI